MIQVKQGLITHVGYYCNKTLQALPLALGLGRRWRLECRQEGYEDPWTSELVKELLAETGGTPCFVLAEHLGKLFPLTN